MRLFDCKEKTAVKSWDVQTAVEKVLWNQYNTSYCIVRSTRIFHISAPLYICISSSYISFLQASLTEGYISYFDVRADKAVWEIKPHNEDVSGKHCPYIFFGKNIYHMPAFVQSFCKSNHFQVLLSVRHVQVC